MSNVSAALVPAAPVLVPGLSGHTMPAQEVRAATLEAIFGHFQQYRLLRNWLKHAKLLNGRRCLVRQMNKP